MDETYNYNFPERPNPPKGHTSIPKQVLGGPMMSPNPLGFGSILKEGWQSKSDITGLTNTGIHVIRKYPTF